LLKINEVISLYGRLIAFLKEYNFTFLAVVNLRNGKITHDETEIINYVGQSCEHPFVATEEIFNDAD